MEHLGPQFAEHVESFRPFAEAQGWNTPDGAMDQCHDATNEWRSNFGGQHMQVGDYRGDPYKAHEKWQQIHSHVPSGTPYWTHHVPVMDTPAGPHVVDWTARQLDSGADFPHVEHLDSFQGRWRNHYLDEPEES